MCKISAAERAVTSSTKNGAVLSVLFSLICSVLSSYFEGNISANLVQPQKLFWRASQRQTRSRCCRQSCRIWAVEAKWQGLHRYHTESKTTTLLPIIREQVKPDSIVYTDCYRSYDVLEVSEFSHLRINYSTHFAERQNHINGIENFWN